MGPLSVDWRKRVVSAVGEEGMSCRAAARRFGISFASAIRWVAALRERGSYAPLPMGGDTRSKRVEAHGDYLLRLHRREPDLTLNEICARLERMRGEKVSPSMIWRFFDRHAITLKNVWPAPSARGFFENRRLISLLQRIRPRSLSSRPRWRYARSGPHKRLGVERRFLSQASGTPFNCQAISSSPLANIG
jgi:transposase